MKYQFSQHALDMMRERKIDVKWVMEVLENPEDIEQDREDESLEHFSAPIAFHGGRILKVIINRRVNPPRVVTAFFDRTARR